jgi:hypothetical protein
MQNRFAVDRREKQEINGLKRHFDDKIAIKGMIIG